MYIVYIVVGSDNFQLELFLQIYLYSCTGVAVLSYIISYSYCSSFQVVVAAGGAAQTMC